MAFKLMNLLLCFNSLRAMTIEILILILSITGIILSIIGLIFIPWKITSEAIEVLHILVLMFFILSFILSITILYFRMNLKLNKRITKILIFASVVMEFICLFALIFLIVISFIIFSDLNDKERTIEIEIIEQTGETQKITNIEKNIVSKSEKLRTILIISIIIALCLFLLFLWISDYVRLIFGMQGSYNDFVANENNRQLKHPIKYGLNVIGHDKYGFPIFGKQVGHKIKIKGVKNKFEEKKSEKINPDGKYFDENGNLNVKYYSNCSQKPMNQKEKEQIIYGKKLYMEKYLDGYQNYTNFENKTILNFDDNNNSINPGYEM